MPPAATPQPPPQPNPTAPPVVVSGNVPPPVIGFTGSGTGGTNGGENGGLASSSGNGGQVGSGDAAQLGGGQLNNVSNPAASSALNEALGPPVFHNLQDALQQMGDFTATDLPGTDDTANSGGDGETILTGGDVAVMNDKSTKKIPLSQAPPQLQQAMNSDILNGVAGAGH